MVLLNFENGFANYKFGIVDPTGVDSFRANWTGTGKVIVKLSDFEKWNTSLSKWAELISF